MKKKIIAITAAVAILAVAIVGGTLAWLTAEDTVTNTFTVGNVAMSLVEDKVDADGKIIPDGQTGAGTTQRNEYHLVPGAVLDKDPTVTITAKSEDCLVYVYIDNQINAAVSGAVSLDINTTKWIPVTGKTGLYKYNATVTYSTTGTKLDAVFTHVTVLDSLTNAQLSTIAAANAEIVVKAYAIQAENLGNTDTDGLAWTALQG